MAAQRSGSVGGGQICARFDQGETYYRRSYREFSRASHLLRSQVLAPMLKLARHLPAQSSLSAMRNSTRWRSRQLKAHPERVNAANRDHASSASRLEQPIEFFERLLDAFPLLKHPSNTSPPLPNH